MKNYRSSCVLGLLASTSERRGRACRRIPLVDRDLCSQQVSAHAGDQKYLG